MSKSFIALIAVMIILYSCTSSQKTIKPHLSLQILVNQSARFNQHFTGFALYDPSTGKFVHQLNNDKYFTPASNTKIFTLLASQLLLPTTLPSFKYLTTGDSIIIKGLGDPTLLHPLWPDHPGLQFLKDQVALNKKIFWIPQHPPQIYGAGWAWDDYIDDYQVELSALPLYGNVVQFRRDSLVDGNFLAEPGYFNNSWVSTCTSNNRFLSRAWNVNSFEIDTSFKGKQFIPFKTDDQTMLGLLSDTLKTKVTIPDGTLFHQSRHWTIQNGPAVDSVYAQMMKISDNFISEQLILMAGLLHTDTCDSKIAIHKTMQSTFNKWYDTIQWYDGSGLSRYNLCTPTSVVHALDTLLTLMGKDRLFRIFPEGGISGTIRNWYHGKQKPYVYAKTGSLMNNHSLSGYVQCMSGKVYIFSFMNSNYTGSVTPIRQEMQKVLEYVRDHY